MRHDWIKRLFVLALMLALALPALPAGRALAEAGVTDAFPEALTLGVKETFQLTPEMVKDVEAKDVVFKSSKPKIASVSASGRITAKKKGTAKIGVGVGDKLLGVCEVIVKAAPKKITLSEKKLLMSAGEEKELTATLPKDTASKIEFSSSDLTVAAVNASGVVKAVGKGKATITARTFNGKKATCALYVLGGAAPKELKLPVSSVLLGVKDTYTLKPQIDEGADALFSYSTVNKKIATVSSSGVITAKKVGKTTITVKTHNGLSATVRVEVMKAPSKITLDVDERLMGVGGTYLLLVTLQPAGSYSTITFTSSNEAVATVDESGKITAVAPGKAVITAKTHNGKKAKCRITVSEAPEK